MKFRKKPVVIEAVQYTYHNLDEVMQFCQQNALYAKPADVLVIHTLEGILTVKVNDWIIKGVKGEFYTCKPDIFEATYEPVEQK